MSVFCSLCPRLPPSPVKRVTYRSYKSFSLDSFLSDLTSLPLITNPSDSLELLVEQYNVGLRELLDLHTPLRSKTVRIRPSAPWINEEVRQARKALRRAERVWRATGLTVHYKILRDRHWSFNRLLVYTKSSFLKAKVADCGQDSRKLFQLVGGLMGATTTYDASTILTSWCILRLLLRENCFDSLWP